MLFYEIRETFDIFDDGIIQLFSYLIKVMFVLMDTNAMELSYFILNTSTTLCYDITCRLQTKTWQIVSVLFFHVLNKDIAFHAIEVFVANRTYHPLSSLM